MTPDPRLLAAKLPLLARPAIAPLEAWRRSLETEGRIVPHPDPEDGGVAARLLLLLETPGPRMPEPRIVSRDNPGGTARNLRRFLAEAGIAREDVLIWNAVPWLVHAQATRNRAVRRAEIAEGLTLLPPLLNLLPALKVAVLAGRAAAAAEPVIARERPGLPALAMPHPSPTYVCTSPKVGEAIEATLREAARLLGA